MRVESGIRMQEPSRLDCEFDLHSYAARLATFTRWPFGRNSTCTADKMAEAGFFHHPSPTEADGVKCYICAKELDSWDVNDDPWKEHEKHSPHCPFLAVTDPRSPSVRDVLTLEMARQRIHLVSQMTKATERCTSGVVDVRKMIMKTDA